MERYRTFSEYCREKYGRRLYRAALDAGMTCPNRDGKISSSGCIFCLGGSGDFAVPYDGEKLEREDLRFNHQAACQGDYIAYFQAYTNTYAPVPRLRKLFQSALDNPLFGGISIATRPDCIDEETVALLKELKDSHPEKLFMTELGLQTIHESTAAYINRGYPLEVFDDCVKRLKEAGIEVTAHVIIGLPHETEEMIYQTIEHLNACGISGVKLQLLHYLKGTQLGRMYEEHPEDFHVLSMEEYADIVAECIGRLNPEIVIHRLTGDGSKEALIAPLWSMDKKKVLNLIRHQMKMKNITQGCRRAE